MANMWGAMRRAVDRVTQHRPGVAKVAVAGVPTSREAWDCSSSGFDQTGQRTGTVGRDPPAATRAISEAGEALQRHRSVGAARRPLRRVPSACRETAPPQVRGFMAQQPRTAARIDTLSAAR